MKAGKFAGAAVLSVLFLTLQGCAQYAHHPLSDSVQASKRFMGVYRYARFPGRACYVHKGRYYYGGRYQDGFYRYGSHILRGGRYFPHGVRKNTLMRSDHYHGAKKHKRRKTRKMHRLHRHRF